MSLQILGEAQVEITDRMKRSVANRKDGVFLRGDFERFGSKAQIGKALGKLKRAGRLVQLGVGVYVRAKPSKLSGKPIPHRPLEVLAPVALKRLGVNVRPSRLTQAYNAGLSTQVPAGVVVNVGKQRVARRLGFNGKLVEYERT